MKKHRTTRWVPKLWERTYLGVLIWVDEVYARSPKWEWAVDAFDRRGRAVSRRAAMKAAEVAVRRNLGRK